MLDHPPDEQVAAHMKRFDFRAHMVFDNSLIDRLVREGYFEKLFGPAIQNEEERKRKTAFR
jgi:hypothetical protein